MDNDADLERLAARLRPAFAKWNRITARRAQILRQIDDLQSQYNETFADSIDEKKCENLVVRYSQRASCKLSDQICDQFPREIRDRIYQHMWHEGDAERVLVCFRERIEGPELKAALPHYVNIDYVSNKFAIEAATIFFEDYGQPSPPCGARIEGLCWVLTHDIFKLGLIPMHHLRHVRVFICSGCVRQWVDAGLGHICTRIVKQTGKNGRGQHTKWTYRMSREGVEGIRKTLLTLPDYNHKEGLQLHVVLWDTHPLCIEWMLKKLRSTYDQLMKAGIRVSFEASGVEEPWEDVTEFYTISAQQWRRKWQEVQRISLSDLNE